MFNPIVPQWGSFAGGGAGAGEISAASAASAIGAAPPKVPVISGLQEARPGILRKEG